MSLPKFLNRKNLLIILLGTSIITLALFLISYVEYQKTQQLQKQIQKLNASSVTMTAKLQAIGQELESLKGQDQYIINKTLKDEIKNIETTYKKSVTTYENLLDLKIQNPKLDKKFDLLFAQAINQLADHNFASAAASLNSLNSLILSETASLAAASLPPTVSAPQNNAAPGSGFSRQTVHTSAGDFVTDIIAADLGSTRVIVDTASDSDCKDNCPVLPLSDYVSRSGAYAGVNGTYFCPADYPSCAGKSNSFDLLVMNKNKHYLNGDNNVYSTNPAVVFSNGGIRFVGAAQDWGRDTGVDGVISNFPLLVSGNNVVFGGNGDPKMGSSGNRSFVGNKGNTVYIGVNHNVTVAQSAIVLKTLGMENAMNLDSGGSTALWSGGYKDGPGRNLPNTILFVRK